MLSNQILHKAIQDIRNITGLDCAVWDVQGICLARSNETMLKFGGQAVEFGESLQNQKIEADAGYFAVYDEDERMYVLVIAGKAPELKIYGQMGVSQLSNLLFAYKEKMDRNRFIQNLLLDNMLLVDIYNQAKKMGVPTTHRRCVYLIEAEKDGNKLVRETLKGLYETGTGDFITAVDEKNVILIKALESTETYQDVEQTAYILADTLNMEAMVKVRVSYGTIVEELKDVSRSYKEAGMAMEVGKIFYAGKRILAYNELGIGRLIHQLPHSLCEMFLKEVFDGDVEELFEEEELATVFAFFKNNLNISETARKLFLHRNTLTYRLEKIQKKTGLDIRVFDDALTFKIAIMVADHMKYMKK